MKWETNEIELLKNFLNEGLTYNEIAVELDRTQRSVQLKTQRLGLLSSFYDINKKSIKTKCIECEEFFIGYIGHNRKFCSSSCSTTYNNQQRKLNYTETKQGKCNGCGVDVIINKQASLSKCKCDECKKYKPKKSYRNCIKDGCDNTVLSIKKYCDGCKYEYYHIYRPQCEFKFSLDEYPDKFNFDLIREHGWYSPTNKNNNLNGVSRDHIYSVKDGFINKIDPIIILHPANCKLMLHSENSSKKTKSDITIEELLDKISKWDENHNPF